MTMDPVWVPGASPWAAIDASRLMVAPENCSGFSRSQGTVLRALPLRAPVPKLVNRRRRLARDPDGTREVEG